MESDSTDSIRQYLTLAARLRDTPTPEGWVVGCYEEFILRYAHEFTYIVPDDLEYGRRGLCYANAARYVLEHDKLHYCEGYALSLRLPIPVPHAWVVDDDGHAIDPTWDYPEGEAFYFGVPFLCDNTWVRLLKLGTFGIIASDWEQGDNDLLRNGVPEEHTPEPYRKEHHGQGRSQSE